MLLHVYSDVTNETDIHSLEVMVNTYVNILKISEQPPSSLAQIKLSDCCVVCFL